MSPKFSSVLAATLGLCLMVGCSSSTSNTAAEEPTSQTAVVNVEDAPSAKALPATAEAPSATAETSPAAAEASPSATEAPPSVGDEPAGVFVEGGIAIRGADPVAYFTAGAYVAGSSEYSYEWGDAVWQFASAENRDLFIGNPTQYAPQYGGYCAWAVSEGYTAAIDPTAWKIVDGKLYLNFNARIQRRWEQDIPGKIARANQNWPGVLSN